MLYLFNSLITPIPPSDKEAVVKITRIDINLAKEVIKVAGGFISAIGHQATAQLLSILLGVQVPTNRIQVFLSPGDQAIALVLKARLPEGSVITLEQINQIGYDLYLIQRIQ
jgi:hypothetical protein